MCRPRAHWEKGRVYIPIGILEGSLPFPKYTEIVLPEPEWRQGPVGIATGLREVAYRVICPVSEWGGLYNLTLSGEYSFHQRRLSP